MIYWYHNGNIVRTSNAPTGSTTTLVIENPKPSGAGVYQCVFKNLVNNGWTLKRNVRLFITSMFL